MTSSQCRWHLVAFLQSEGTQLAGSDTLESANRSIIKKQCLWPWSRVEQEQTNHLCCIQEVSAAVCAVYNVTVALNFSFFKPQIEAHLSFIPSTSVKLNLMSLQLGLVFGLDESSLISFYDHDWLLKCEIWIISYLFVVVRSVSLCFSAVGHAVAAVLRRNQRLRLTSECSPWSHLPCFLPISGISVMNKLSWPWQSLSKSLCLPGLKVYPAHSLTPVYRGDNFLPTGSHPYTHQIGGLQIKTKLIGKINTWTNISTTRTTFKSASEEVLMRNGSF